jgi:hypothetical protein
LCLRYAFNDPCSFTMLVAPKAVAKLTPKMHKDFIGARARILPDLRTCEAKDLDAIGHQFAIARFVTGGLLLSLFVKLMAIALDGNQAKRFVAAHLCGE